MKTVCRPAGLRDAPDLAALEGLCFAHAGERFSVRVIRGLVRNPRACVRIVRRQGRAIGWAAGLLRRAGRARAGRLYALAVHPAHRGRGTGRALACAVLAELRRRGARTLSLEVRADQPGPRRLYERLGFAAAEPLPGYYGPGLDGLRMRKKSG